MANVLFLESGSDATQDLSFFPAANTFTSGSSTVASASDQAHTGARSIKVVVANSAEEAAFGTPDNTFSSASGLVSVWVRLSTTSPGALTSLFTLYLNGGGGSVLMAGINTNGKLRLSGVAGSPFGKDGSTVLAATTWYRVSLSWNITSGSNFSAKLYLNGSLEVTLTNTDGTLSQTGTQIVLFGADNDVFGSAAAITVWFDDIYIDDRTDQSDCGSISVTTKRPFANGTANNFSTQIGAGGSGYGSGHSSQVNERPLSETNGWSKVGAGSAVTEEYNIENVSTGDVNLTGATISGVMGWAWLKTLVSETGKIVVDGTQTNITTTTSPSLFTKISATPTVFPAGSGTDIGVVTDTTLTTFSLYECGILVAYTPVVSGDTQEWLGSYPVLVHGIGGMVSY